MNFTFMIDNCLSSCQITYNGLSILDYSKSAVEYFVKKRIKNPENKYDSYHLFSSNSSISTWNNDIGHFLQQIKTIQPQFETNFNLEDCFHNLNKFRTLNGTDNLYGGRDVLKIETGIVFLFTNREYHGPEFKHLLRWDYRLLVFLLQPPGLEEQNVELLETNWHSIAETVGCGLCFEIQDFNQMFQILDDPKLTPPQIAIQLSILDQKYIEQIRYEDFQTYMETNRLDQQLLKQQSSWFIRSVQKQNFQFASQRLKSQSNMTIFTKVYLPEIYPINDFSNYPSYPEYFIDFSNSLQARMPQFIPYQEITIENQNLLNIVQTISSIRRSPSQFPIIFLDKRDDQINPLLIGLMVYIQNQPLLLRFYFPNFLFYLDVFKSLQNHSISRRISEQKFLTYVSQIPNYYGPCIKRNLQENDIQISRSFIFVIDEQNQQHYTTKIKTFQGKIQRLKKQIDDEGYKNRQLHVSRKSFCCAALSDNYNARYKEQINCQYRDLTQIQKEYEFKKFLPEEEIQSCIAQMPTNPVTLRDPDINPDEIEIRLEPAFCGNPWKLFRKTYRDGIEIRSEQEEQQVEDMMLTKVDSETKSVFKNRRKGFMRMKDIANGNHKQSQKNSKDEEFSKMEIEETSIEQPLKQKTKMVTIKYNPEYQTNKKMEVLAKMNNSVSTTF